MGIGATVEFRGVEVVSESDLALCCRITGRDHWIAPDRLSEVMCEDGTRPTRSMMYAVRSASARSSSRS
jgi:hypothetical protein